MQCWRDQISISPQQETKPARRPGGVLPLAALCPDATVPSPRDVFASGRKWSASFFFIFVCLLRFLFVQGSVFGPKSSASFLSFLRYVFCLCLAVCRARAVWIIERITESRFCSAMARAVVFVRLFRLLACQLPFSFISSRYRRGALLSQLMRYGLVALSLSK